MRISYSRFATYQMCPQQYKLQYVDRVPVPTAVVLHFGSAVHEALNFMYDPRHLRMPELEAVVQEYVEADAAEGEAKQRKERAQALIHEYLDRCEAERAEGGGYVAERRRYKRVAGWDAERLRGVLGPLGLWDRATQVSSSAIKRLLGSGDLSGEQKREVETAAEYRETRTLRVKPAGGGEDAEETEE